MYFQSLHDDMSLLSDMSIVYQQTKAVANFHESCLFLFGPVAAALSA